MEGHAQQLALLLQEQCFLLKIPAKHGTLIFLIDQFGNTSVVYLTGMCSSFSSGGIICNVPFFPHSLSKRNPELDGQRSADS